jgi:hypothetical protein
LEGLLELLAIQLGEQLRIQVKVNVKTQAQTHVSTQVSTRVRILLPILPGELFRVLLEEDQSEVLGRNQAARVGYAVLTFARGAGQTLSTFWTGYWTAGGS